MKARNEKEFVDNLGKRIATIRRLKGYTQESLAEKAELDRMTIALIETGRKKPSIRTVFKLAKTLDTEPAEFFVNT